MEILLDAKTIVPLLFGAALALIGGVVTQLAFWLLSLRHTRKTLETALRAELKVIRERLGSTLAGYRDSLRANDPPKISVFSFPSPVFDSNAGNLGQLHNKDFVEHVVEVYSAIHALRCLSDAHSNSTKDSLELRDYNEMHMDATTTHVQVIKLHNRFLGITALNGINVDETEVESREFVKELNDLVSNGNFGQALQKSWAGA